MSYETIRGIMTILEDLGKTEAMGVVRAAVDKLEEKDAEIERLTRERDEIEAVARRIVLHWYHADENKGTHESTVRFLETHTGKVELDIKKMADLRRERDEARKRPSKAELFAAWDALAALRARVKTLEEGLREIEEWEEGDIRHPSTVARALLAGEEEAR